MPVEPEPSRWQLDLSQAQPEEDLVGVGADLEPGTLLRAYRAGLFPMGLGRHGRGPIGWWSPDPRGVLLPGDLKVSRSLRKSCRRFEVRVDTAFTAVMHACADPRRDGRWITPAVVRAYSALHELGWAHSVETWLDGELVGGLYGLAVGGLFAGESMFHHATDASKVALVALAERAFADGDPARVIDVQWSTPHLQSLGIREIPREEYVARLAEALALPLPAAFA
ncbi:leucyl/phenylalanyl-tRNA--protein transferase [Oryzihumus sp.]|uniref:leucyl/phenylalanyl-tRNA--protein transferase n=1 Tax=Oryzihumus sp. TaxID=1968903 RepID=UPI002ED9E2F2